MTYIKVNVNKPGANAGTGIKPKAAIQAAQEAHARMAAEAAAAANRDDEATLEASALDPEVLGDSDIATVAMDSSENGVLSTDLGADLTSKDLGEAGEGI